MTRMTREENVATTLLTVRQCPRLRRTGVNSGGIRMVFIAKELKNVHGEEDIPSLSSTHCVLLCLKT